MRIVRDLYMLIRVSRRWMVERGFDWMTRFRRPMRDYEPLAETLIGLRFVAFAMLVAHRFVTLMDGTRSMP